MKKYWYLSLALIPIIAVACKSNKEDLPVVPHVDIEKYLGKWYEIARLPNRFEKGLICCTADYSLNLDGSVKVINTGVKESDGSVNQATGKATIPDKNEPAKLDVSFFWPFKADYWIIDLSEDYEWAAVGAPDRETFWILAREKSLPPERMQSILNKAHRLGFDTTKLIFTPQNC